VVVAEHGGRAGGGGGAAASPGGGGDLGGRTVGIVGGGNTLAIEGARMAAEDWRWAMQRGDWGAISAAGDRSAVDKAEGRPVPEEDEEAAVRPRGRHSGGHVQPVTAYGDPYNIVTLASILPRAVLLLVWCWACRSWALPSNESKRVVKNHHACQVDQADPRLST
jgi:hypothetical protein